MSRTGCDAGHPVPPADIPNTGAPKAGGSVEAYIRQAATARGIDPDVAVQVAKSEGGLGNPFQQSKVHVDANGKVVKTGGTQETSFGPFQLRINGGLGDEALKAGVDPRKDWHGGWTLPLNYAAKNGWGPWQGAVNPRTTSGYKPISGTAGLEGAQPVAIGTATAYTGGPPQTAAQQAAAGLAAGQRAPTLRKGATDAKTGGAVTRLQQQLADAASTSVRTGWMAALAGHRGGCASRREELRARRGSRRCRPAGARRARRHGAPYRTSHQRRGSGRRAPAADLDHARTSIRGMSSRRSSATSIHSRRDQRAESSAVEPAWRAVPELAGQVPRVPPGRGIRP